MELFQINWNIQSFQNLESCFISGAYNEPRIGVISNPLLGNQKQQHGERSKQTLRRLYYCDLRQIVYASADIRSLLSHIDAESLSCGEVGLVRVVCISECKARAIYLAPFLCYQEKETLADGPVHWFRSKNFKQANSNYVPFLVVVSIFIVKWDKFQWFANFFLKLFSPTMFVVP